MFESYFGLSANPFTIAPNPGYLYLSDQHREALAHLQYGLHENGGFIVLTGEVGTGKTTMWRCLYEQLPEDVELAVILNPCLNSRELLQAICDEFDVQYKAQAGIKQLTDALNRHLLAQNENGKRCVLIVEEAQDLDDALLEQLRLLTNLETNRSKLLQIVLIGQPELAAKIDRPALRQLKQRIIARFHLRPLSAKEIKTYVEHRLSVAGGSPALFSRDALRRLAKWSGGVPRLINLICERALLGCFAEGKRRVTLGILDTAAREIAASAGIAPASRRPAMVRIAAFVLVAGAAVLLAERAGKLSSDGDKMPLVVVAEHRGQDVAGKQPPVEDAIAQAGNAPAASLQAPVPADGAGADAQDGAIASAVDQQEPGATVSLAGKVVSASQQSAVSAQQGAIERLQQDSVQGDAYRLLFDLWGVDFAADTGQPACQYGLRHRLDCWHRRDGLTGVKRLNRPAVLKMVSAQGGPFYAVLTGITDDGVLRMNAGGGDIELTEDELRSAWTGEYTLLWKRPAGYRDTLYPGDKSSVVRRVADNLAAVTGAPRPAHQSQVYTAELENRVRTFQSRCGLFVDGLIGRETLIRLNMLGNPSPLLHSRGAACRNSS